MIAAEPPENLTWTSFFHDTCEAALEVLGYFTDFLPGYSVPYNSARCRGRSRILLLSCQAHVQPLRLCIPPVGFQIRLPEGFSAMLHQMLRILNSLWFLQIGSGRGQGLKCASWLYVSLCPPDVVAIFKAFMSVMNLSDRDLSCIPPRDLSTREKRIKSLLSAFFPGNISSDSRHC